MSWHHLIGCLPVEVDKKCQLMLMRGPGPQSYPQLSNTEVMPEHWSVDGKLEKPVSECLLGDGNPLATCASL